MSLIFSHINYCNLIWGSACMTSLQPLFVLQKKAVRIVNGSKYLDHTDPIFKSLKVLTVHNVFKVNSLVFIYKCLKMNRFPLFKKKLIKNSDLYSYNTRHNNKYRLPIERLEICRKSFFVEGIALWNLLDNDTKLSNNVYLFKRKIKLQIFE